jgi:hypothetical protein
VYVEAKVAAEPIIPLRLFKDRTVTLATIASVLIGVAMFGSTVYLSQYFQVARGMSPTEAGLMSICMVGGLLVSSITTGRRITATGRWRAFGGVEVGPEGRAPSYKGCPRGALVAAGCSAGVMLLLAGALVVGGSSLRASLGSAIGDFVNGYFAWFHVPAARVVRTLLFSGFAFTGILTFLLAAAKANDAFGFVKVDGWVSKARQLGEFTFPLYLFHFPLLALLASLGAYNRASSIQKVVLFCVVCGVCFALTPATAALKFKLRRLFRLSRPVAAAAARPAQ